MDNCEKPIIKVEPILDEQTNTTKVIEDTEVDIVSWTNKGDFASNKNEDPDATEYSSSFASTTSDAEDCSRLSDAEVESEFLGDNDMACPFDTFGSALRMRKKKLTDHWRNFVRPLMWRCKWAELKIKEIESQASKYSKELAEYDKTKHMEPDHFTLEEFGSKSLPFSSDQYRSKAKKRRKRKKVEDTTELETYSSQHYLFSYLENKKSDPDGCSADDFGNPVITEVCNDSTERFGVGEDQFFAETNDGDASLEQLLWSIDNLHSRVHSLRGDIETVISKNASKFSSSENLSLHPHCDVQTSSAQSPTVSAVNGETASVGAIYNSAHHVAKFGLGHLVMPDSAVSSFGEVAVIPDIIESTVGLLSAADVTLQCHPALAALTGDSCENMVDSVLIHEVAETEDHTFRSASHHSVEKGEGEEAGCPAASQEQSSLRSCINRDANFPKNKRKRGERKAGSVGWNKKSSGEPDNH